jgi:hypothetical protein
MNTQTYRTEETRALEATGLNRLTSRASARAALSLRRFSNACLVKLNDVKEKISRQLMAEYGARLNPAIIRQAVLEADSLAATTPFPTLFLPTLAEEKVRSASAWNRRQAAIRDQTLGFAA